MKTVLYLGTDPEHFLENHRDCKVVHYPVIRIVLRKIEDEEVVQAYKDLPCYTHILFTSKNAVQGFFELLALFHYDKQLLYHKTFVAIGTATALALKCILRAPDLIAQQETQEGLIALLSQYCLTSAYILLPRSSLSRPLLLTFLKNNRVQHRAFDLYDTVLQKLEPLPNLDLIDEIVFTSPSTVKGFLQIFGKLPKDKNLRTLGQITKQILNEIKF